MIVGCYSMHVYCDHFGCRASDDLTGKTEAAAKKEGRLKGWWFASPKVFCKRHHPRRKLSLLPTVGDKS